MTFVTDKEELKPGLVIFRRADVQHRNWYCRVKLPKENRYKTVSLHTADIQTARTLAWDKEGEVRYAIKLGVPLFNRSFDQVGQEYLTEQQARARRGEITTARSKVAKSVIKGQLREYVSSTQIHLVGQESWDGYPEWRRLHGKGLIRSRIVDGEREMADGKPVYIISDSTIRFEMAIFRAIMTFATKKRYIQASDRFTGRPKLQIMRRDEFTLEEYRTLHTKGRAWMKEATKPSSLWYRTVVYNFMLIMCNTGMRPSEARNLRWRDVATAHDRDGREIVVLAVHGKSKARKLVAPQSVGDYIGRIRSIAKASGPDDRVFTNVSGKPSTTLYKHLVGEMLEKAELREGPNGIPRSTYCFRHTYATFRLSEGVDVYFLAEQMGTSVQMIEDHYGHVNTVKHADRVLQGIGGWNPAEDDDAEAKAKAPKRAQSRDQASRPAAKPKGRPSSRPAGQRTKPR